ncbi:MAG: DNA repair protein RecN, partial [Pseudomonadota bacterium]
LTALHIQDFVLIDQARLSVERGLTALTGETGAGKSILLDALGFAVGGRLGRGAVRRGAEKGVVTAVFEPAVDHAVWRLMRERDLDTDEDQLILKRTLSAAGKSRAAVNDQPVSISLLRELGGTVLEIHGQHEGHGFLSAATHRALLDEFGDLQDDLSRVDAAWQGLKAAREALAELEETRSKSSAEADYLRHVVSELQALAPQADEEAALAARRNALMAAETVRDDLAQAAALLADDGLESRLGACAARLLRAQKAFNDDCPPLASAIARLDEAQSGVADAIAAVGDAASALDVDTDELEAVEERLFALRGAARKYGVVVDALPDFLNKAENAVMLVDESTALLDARKKALSKAEATYGAAAETLSEKRRRAAAHLDEAVAKELAPLKLEKAAFTTLVERDDAQATVSGVDRVEFLVSTNPGAPAAPLKQIASGGELSRFVLAMKAALAAKENRTVIIFDEVDAGVGGAVAAAVGERLARLARDAQVLVVTHSPQVAASARRHWRVEKNDTTSGTITRIERLSDEAREEEIARMISGESVSDEARAAARKLMGTDKARRSSRAPARRRKSA